jgi:chromosome segregation ATPase
MLRDSDAQFILVTHNNAMIQYAQSVVGVSMSEGVSRIVGVKLEAA